MSEPKVAWTYCVAHGAGRTRFHNVSSNDMSKYLNYSSRLRMKFHAVAVARTRCGVGVGAMNAADAGY